MVTPAMPTSLPSMTPSLLRSRQTRPLIALFKGSKTVMLTVQAPEDAGLDDEQVVALIKSVKLGQAAVMSVVLREMKSLG